MLQTGFEVFTDSQKEELMQELIAADRVKDCSLNFNGNHVMQQIVIQMGHATHSSSMCTIVSTIEQNILAFCLNEFGCRIVQRVFEKCCQTFTQTVGDAVIRHFDKMERKEYGIFVISALL